MSYELPDYLWAPQRNGIEQTIGRLKAGKDVCMYGPTGSGKTQVAIELINWALDRGLTSSFYVNRKLLIGQTASRFGQYNLPYGIRAAEYDDMYDFSAPVQICSADTERARCIQRKTMDPFNAGLVIVDEAHIQKASTMQTILDRQKEEGAKVVLLTATPVGVEHLADELVISGSMQDYRDCNAIVPAEVRTVTFPDLHKVKRTPVGEFVMSDGNRGMKYVQQIVSDVIDGWKKWNPDGRSTMMYAPGVKESRWLTEQFEAIGVPWCHVDATEAYLEGCRVKLNRSNWEEILERYKDGDIVGLSSRFKLREGIDVPETYFGVLATPIGSLLSYIQTIGRILRYSEATPDRVRINDHGGNFVRHGSPNMERPWDEWWGLKEGQVSRQFEYDIRDRKKPEPICCPKCGGERLGGVACPFCNFVCDVSRRPMRMADGKLKVIEGDYYKKKQRKEKKDTRGLWKRLVTSHRKKCENNPDARKMSFRAMEAYFFNEFHHWPPLDIPYMPKFDADRDRYIVSVDYERLVKEDFV